MDLNDVLLRPAGLYPDKTAVKYLSRQLSYSQLYRNACRTGNALLASGVKAGDSVCIVCRNSVEYVEAMFAVSLIGAVPALINWRLAPPAIYDMIRQVNARVVFISNTEDWIIRFLQEKAGDALQLIITPHDPDLGADYEAFRADAPDTLEPVRKDEESAALIMFTSGTTGRSKAVELSNRSISSQVLRCAGNGRWYQEDVFLCLSPLCHAISLSVMALLYMGGELLLCPPEYIRDCGIVLDIIEREHVTSTALVPTVINRLVTYMEKHHRTNNTVKYIHYGASPMTWELLSRCAKVFSCKFHQGYGMTETYGTVVTLVPEDHLDARHLLSVGRPVAGNEIRIVDEKGNSLPAGAVGEICVKTRSVMTGYIGMPERTAEVLTNGWYHTGDMGYLDEEGYLFLKDRKCDMIITGGENVFPQEVERCIQELADDVAAVCVAGIEDPVWGESIAAAVVRRPGSAISEQQIMDHCGERLGRYKKPKQILFVDELPTTEVGKISRARVQALFTQDNQKQE